LSSWRPTPGHRKGLPALEFWGQWSSGSSGDSIRNSNLRADQPDTKAGSYIYCPQNSLSAELAQPRGRLYRLALAVWREEATDSADVPATCRRAN